MSNIAEHAKRELAIMRKNANLDKMGTEMQDNMDACLLELLEVFNKQGHSGFSANYVLRLFNKLAMFKPLTPLTGEDNEWMPMGKNSYQNNRDFSVFKEDGVTYTIDGYIFEDEKGFWYTNAKSRKNIEFPYYPTEPERVKHNSELYKQLLGEQ
jgi:hypothetical protein